ncbi:polar amino acid transport system substrate-binding protein [Inhella inkyongensis]|uniref:Polar amino acid transport system substrate-binding protein n=1 Tax=Inhella inkyongensis TaxID=392593 RepID=A0A840S7M1_9BURK|nr:transporter substrate-binding domain-containing protein [Inhella inkyongensis]MBB5204561.1 polar amino acid transport system substrate-binding protein [Inhella inkyongensis]
MAWRCLLYLLLGLHLSVAAQPDLDGGRRGLYLRLCVDEAPSAPWRVPDADGRVRGRGLEFEFLRLLAEQSGWEFRVLLRPWRRCLQDVRTGQVDAVLGISHTADRAEFVQFPHSNGQVDPQLAVRVDQYAFVAPSASKLRWDGAQLELPPGAKVGVPAGYSGAQLLRRFGAAADESSRTAEGTLERLMQGQIQAALLPRAEAQRLLAERTQWAQRLSLLEPALPARAYYLGASLEFARRHPGRLRDLWRDVALVRDSAEYRRVLAQTP